jgi:hypothetical protein
MNTDRGVQFTNTAFTDVLQQDRIQIVMDGKVAYYGTLASGNYWVAN